MVPKVTQVTMTNNILIIIIIIIFIYCRALEAMGGVNNKSRITVVIKEK